jgi:hypothetical protein
LQIGVAISQRAAQCACSVVFNPVVSQVQNFQGSVFLQKLGKTASTVSGNAVTEKSEKYSVFSG